MNLRPLSLALCTALLAVALHAQTGDQAAAKNAQQARDALNAMVTALGGPAWLNMQNQLLVGQVAGFFHGDPDPGTTTVFEYHEWPDKDRIEVTKHRDVDEMYIGRQGWEVTYRGKRPIPKDQLEEYLRRRDHSIETAVKVWMKDPNTIFVYEGQHLAERHLAEQVTLISPKNESITILIDQQTHLPLQRIFQWRDPTYHDKNTEIEEYDNYRPVDGIQTPYAITRVKNGETVSQFYITQVRFNQKLSPDFWDVNYVAHKTKGK
jgi:hypothetical protein